MFGCFPACLLDVQPSLLNWPQPTAEGILFSDEQSRVLIAKNKEFGTAEIR
jgi:hypothetical protein